MRELSVFEKATERFEKNGRHIVKCKKGLWEVDAATPSQATVEAVHYFILYAMDGEYREFESQPLAGSV